MVYEMYESKLQADSTKCTQLLFLTSLFCREQAARHGNFSVSQIPIRTERNFSTCSPPREVVVPTHENMSQDGEGGIKKNHPTVNTFLIHSSVRGRVLLRIAWAALTARNEDSALMFFPVAVKTVGIRFQRSVWYSSALRNLERERETIWTEYSLERRRWMSWASVNRYTTYTAGLCYNWRGNVSTKNYSRSEWKDDEKSLLK